MKDCSMTLLELLSLFSKLKSSEFEIFLEDFPCDLEIDELRNELDKGYEAIKKNKYKLVELLEQDEESTSDEDELSSDRSPKPPTDDLER